jgi:hypothetical protein
MSETIKTLRKSSTQGDLNSMADTVRPASNKAVDDWELK